MIRINSNQLTTPLKSFTAGRAEIWFNDEIDSETDRYRLVIQNTNLGYTAHGSLNNATSYQLAGHFFPRDTPIGTVLMLMSGAGIVTDTYAITKFYNCDNTKTAPIEAVA